MRRKAPLLEVADRHLSGDLDEPAFQRVLCETIAEQARADRASLWFYVDGLRDALRCAVVIDRVAGRADAGMIFGGGEAAPWIDALRRDGEVVADDLAAHPAARALVRDPADAASRIDVVFGEFAAPAGVLSCERTGPSPAWADADIEYLRQAGVVLETTHRHRFAFC